MIEHYSCSCDLLDLGGVDCVHVCEGMSCTAADTMTLRVRIIFALVVRTHVFDYWVSLMNGSSIMKSFYFCSLIVVALVTDPVVSSFALDKNSKVRRQQVSEHLDPVAPGVKHHTHRLDFPGKHKEGAWFLPQSHKQKHDTHKESDERRGRKWSFGRVPWW